MILFKDKEKTIALFMISIVIKVFLAIFHLLFFNWEIFPSFPWDQLIIGTIEPYLDYKLSYKTFAEAFIYQDWVPYVLEVSDPILSSYVYPPLFLYAISLPALLSTDLVFIPLLLADVLSPIVIYRFLDRSHGKEVAHWGLVATALCPFSIFYNSGLLFNTSLVMLFFILSLYLIYIERFKWATVVLAVAFLFKQIVLFFIIPVLLFISLKSTEDTQALLPSLVLVGKHIIIFLCTFFVGSLPWILIGPEEYLGTLFMGQQITFSPSFVAPAMTWPVHWYDFLIELNAPYWVIYIVGFLNFTMFGLILVQLANICLLIRWYLKNSLFWDNFLNLIVYNAVLNHLFLPRGVYKYYFTILVPLIVLWIGFNLTPLISSPHSQKKIFLIFTMVSLTLLFVHRLFYLLILWIILFYMSKHNLKYRHLTNQRSPLTMEIGRLI
ncbi:MAG: hypothetical protein ACFE95_11495 [Candidatus Hodarchaeota archaeon]